MCRCIKNLIPVIRVILFTMKKIAIIIIAIFFGFIAHAQKKLPAPKPSPSTDMNKMMEQMMKQSGMSKEEMKEMQSMMGVANQMKADSVPFYAYEEVTDNKSLLPLMNAKQIAVVGKPLSSDDEVKAKAVFIYAKVNTKAPASDKKIINAAIAKCTTADEMESAAITSLLNGYPLAAIALAAKAVQLNAGSAVYQNNLAAILTQSGYPEQSVPILSKLEKQFPKNSSILTNMGYAWFYMGDKTKSQQYISRALAVNPGQPSANVCGGIIHEIEGDPVKSEQELENAFENCPDGFTEILINNKGGKDAASDLTFDKIKDKITIYEYIKDDWIKSLPAYTNGCTEDNINNDEELRMGYADMIHELYKKLAVWEDSIHKYEEKYEQTYGNTSDREKMKAAMMRPDKATRQTLLQARGIYNIIRKHLAELQDRWGKSDFASLDSMMTEHETVGPPSIVQGEDNCPKQRKWDCDFLSNYNPMRRDTALKLLEDFRLTINAELTWSWFAQIYDTDLEMVAYQFRDIFTPFVDLLRETAEKYVLPLRPCKLQNETFAPKAKPTNQPALPQLECPINVSIPTGMNFTTYAGADAGGSGANSFDIKPSPSNPVPNVQVGMGLDANAPSEPGNKATPFVQTANGNTSVMNIKSTDDELAPLAKIDPDKDDLAPLAIIDPNKDDLAPLATIDPNKDDLAPLADIEGKVIKQFLHDLMSDCNHLHKFTPEEIKHKVHVTAGQVQQATEERLGDLLKRMKAKRQSQQAQTPPADTQKLDNAINAVQNKINAVQKIDINNLGNNGIVPTVVNGMQLNVQPLVPGLFQ